MGVSKKDIHEIIHRFFFNKSGRIKRVQLFVGYKLDIKYKTLYNKFKKIKAPLREAPLRGIE